MTGEKKLNCKNSSTRSFFINVQNKPNIGGIETLVSDFQFILNEKGVANKIFYLAESKLSIYLFSKSFYRKLLIVVKSINLILKVYTELLIRNQKKIYVFFYHAECHLVLRLVFPFLKGDSRIVPIIYLCQSPHIYPQKLLNGTRQIMNEISTIVCYSETVAKLWKNLETVQIHSVFSPIRMQRVYDAESSPTQMNKGLNLVHVGRNVAYKSPEKSLDFAIQVAKIAPEVCLTFIGIQNLPEISKHTIPKNLEIKFLGVLQNSLKLSKNATAMLNFADYRLTGEVIGIAALESLAVGVPVIVHSLNQTGYSKLPGILTADNFLKLLSQKKDGKHFDASNFRLDQKEITEIHDELSLELYFETISRLIGLKKI